LVLSENQARANWFQILLPHERGVQIGLLTPQEGVAGGVQQIAVLPLWFLVDSTASWRQRWRLATSCRRIN